MDKIKELLGGINKRWIAIGLFVLLVFVGLSATRCVQVHAPETDGGEQQQDAVEDPGQELGNPALTAEQQELVSSYDDDIREFIGLLSANAWTASGGSKSLSFDESSFTEVDGGEETATSFAISAYEVSEDSSTDVNGRTENTVEHRAAILTDRGTYFLTLREFSSPGSDDTEWSVTSEAFSNSGSYTRAASAGSVSVTGLNSEIDALFGGRSAELVKAIQDYCAVNYPSATEAKWTSSASLDWSTSTVLTTFTLNNDAESEITATYSTDSGSILVESLR